MRELRYSSAPLLPCPLNLLAREGRPSLLRPLRGVVAITGIGPMARSTSRDRIGAAVVLHDHWLKSRP